MISSYHRLFSIFKKKNKKKLPKKLVPSSSGSHEPKLDLVRPKCVKLLKCSFDDPSSRYALCAWDFGPKSYKAGDILFSHCEGMLYNV